MNTGISSNFTGSQYELDLKLATSTSSNVSDIESMKIVIAMNIMMANLHMADRTGLGLIKFIWKKELPA